MDFTQLHNNLSGVIESYENIVLGAAMKSEEIIVDLNTSQLEQGKTSENKNIEPSYYSLEYAKLKKSMGKLAPGSVPDLKFSGDFHKGFYVSLKDGWIELHSTDYKEAMLRKKYSDDIFGLTKGNLKELTTYMIDDLINTLLYEFTRG